MNLKKNFIHPFSNQYSRLKTQVYFLQERRGYYIFFRGESKSPGIGKTEGELYLPREELFFPQSDSCLAEAIGRG